MKLLFYTIVLSLSQYPHLSTHAFLKLSVELRHIEYLNYLVENLLFSPPRKEKRFKKEYLFHAPYTHVTDVNGKS